MKLDHASPNESPLAMNELASSIGRLLEVAQNDFAIWTEDELRDVFEYQLAATLDGDLGLFFDDVAGEVARSGFVTFGDLLTSNQPSLPLLHMVRQFAKKLSAGEHAYPTDIALALYFAVIAAAEVRAGENITSMSREELQQGYSWTKTRPWLPSHLCTLFEQVSP